MVEKPDGPELQREINTGTMAAQGKKFRTEMSEIWMDEEGILHLKFLKEGEVDLEEVRTCFRTYTEMGIGPDAKVLQIIDASNFAALSTEARDLAAKVGQDYFIASAAISTSPAIRLIVNFFNSFYKITVPFKLFGTEEEAREWLRTFKK
jgi:hypothetical protein